MGERKYNKVNVLPLAEDIEILGKYIGSAIKDGVSLLNKEKNNKAIWKNLAEATLTRLLTFNKRRAGEASKLTVEAYINRPNWKEAFSAEIMRSLNGFEKELTKR